MHLAQALTGELGQPNGINRLNGFAHSASTSIATRNRGLRQVTHEGVAHKLGMHFPTQAKGPEICTHMRRPRLRASKMVVGQQGA